ncbi:hypothetical protein PF005_g1323 [Phytophthora fragariae]|uniref:Uncharacterized protein n=1 Tax=Phytophthora fragariae TaxID=53985 RepID=A0A6A3ZI33_9STRA|nr:hypothetical protein PF005_g1323 [Phytophthora fragariae]
MVGGAGKEPRYKMTAQERLLCREALLSDRHARRIRRSSSTTGAEGERHKKASRKEGAKRTTVAMGLRGALEAAPAPGAALSVAEAKDADVESTPSAEAKGADVERAPSAEAQDADEDAPDAAGPAISQPVTAAEVIADMVTAVVDDTATEQPGPGRNVRKPRRAILEDLSCGAAVVAHRLSWRWAWQARSPYQSAAYRGAQRRRMLGKAGGRHA